MNSFVITPEMELSVNEHVRDFVRLVPAFVDEANYACVRRALNAAFTEKMAEVSVYGASGRFIEALQKDVPRAYRHARALLDERLRESSPAYWQKMTEGQV